MLNDRYIWCRYSKMVLPSISPGPYISHFPTICFYYRYEKIGHEYWRKREEIDGLFDWYHTLILRDSNICFILSFRSGWSSPEWTVCPPLLLPYWIVWDVIGSNVTPINRKPTLNERDEVYCKIYDLIRYNRYYKYHENRRLPSKEYTLLFLSNWLLQNESWLSIHLR